MRNSKRSSRSAASLRKRATEGTPPPSNKAGTTKAILERAFTSACDSWCSLRSTEYDKHIWRYHLGLIVMEDQIDQFGNETSHHGNRHPAAKSAQSQAKDR